MKKFAIFIFCILVVVASFHTLTQSHFFKTKMYAILNEKFNESGIDLKIQNIESTYPEIVLDAVTLNTSNLILKAQKIKAEISLLSLLKGKIVLSFLRIEDLNWQYEESLNEETVLSSKNNKQTEFDIWIEDLTITHAKILDNHFGSLNAEIELRQSSKQPFILKSSGQIQLSTSFLEDLQPYDFSIFISQNSEEKYQLEQLLFQNNKLKLEAIGSLQQDFSLDQAKLQIQTSQIKNLSSFDISGKLFASFDIDGTKKTISGQARIPILEVSSLNFPETKASFVGHISNENISGNLSLSAFYLDEKWDLITPAIFSINKLSFPKIELSSNAGFAQGDLGISSGSIILSSKFSFNDLHKIYPDFFGTAKGTFNIGKEQLLTHADLDCKIEGFFFDNFSADTITIYSEFHNFFKQKPLGVINCDFAHAKWHDLVFESAFFETSLQSIENPFTLIAKGQWKHPLEIEMAGTFDWTQNKKQIITSSLEGSFYNHPLKLKKPAEFTIENDNVTLSPLSLEMEKGLLDFSLKKDFFSSQINLKINLFPCDILSLNPLDIPIDGQFNLDSYLKSSNNELFGKCNASIQNLTMDLFNQTDPIEGNMSLEAVLEKNHLDGRFNFDVRQTPLMNFSFSLPLQIEMFPWNYKLLDNERFFVKTFISGYLEDLLDFFDLGTNRIEGKCVCDLEIFNTLKHPKLSGGIDFSRGFYQNYYSGIELDNIYAKFQAKGSSLSLTQFSASDLHQRNSIKAKGDIDFNLQKLFPYNFTIDLNRFTFNGLDLATIDVSGNLLAQGDFSSGNISGNLKINEGDISLPNKLPNLPPDLQVNYINQKKPLLEKPSKKKIENLTNLDITCQAEDSVFLTGFGVDSEWKGDLKIQGTTDNPLFIGQVDLGKGKFSFSGRNFILHKGFLRFSEKNNATPFISVNGSINIKDVEIFASINGPLNNPQITFQSSPPLPLGSIAAYLLFGQDIAEISSLQALELATALSSFSGHSSSFFEETKKSLGVDRIQIVTVADPSTESGEKMALQVGKYVQEDVLVSYTQAAEYSAGDISIEISFKGGTSFVLESDQADEQKQGKFSFKWSKTY